MPVTQECVDFALFSIHFESMWNVPSHESHHELKQKTFKQGLSPPRSSHTRALGTSGKLENDDASALVDKIHKAEST